MVFADAEASGVIGALDDRRVVEANENGSLSPPLPFDTEHVFRLVDL